MPGLWQQGLVRSRGDVERSGSAPRVRDGVRAALPLAPSPMLFGLSFGVLAKTAGMSLGAAVVMSATTFAGASQFAARLGPRRRRHRPRCDPRRRPPERPLHGDQRRRRVDLPRREARAASSSRSSIVDESWALSGRGGRFEWPVLIGSGILLYVLWVASTAAGTFVGELLERPGRARSRRRVRCALPRAPRPYLKAGGRGARPRCWRARSRSCYCPSRRRASRSSRPPRPASLGLRR